jgi:non-ribosomal peptide synthetase component F
MESAREISTSWKYRAKLFESATIARMAGEYEGLLRRILEKPDARLSELAVPTRAERAREASGAVKPAPRGSRRKAIELPPVRPMNLAAAPVAPGGGNGTD